MSARDAHILTTLEDLAQRRRHCTTTIVNLCAFYQVDPAPYLDGPGAAPGGVPASTERRKVEPRAKRTAARPRRPASHATNGTGRADKVSKGASKRDAILEALTKHGEAMSPADLAKTLGFADVAALRYYTRQLEADGLVKSTGGPANRQLQLA